MINIETFHRTPVRGRSYALSGKSSTETSFRITESFRAVADTIYLPLHFDWQAANCSAKYIWWCTWIRPIKLHCNQRGRQTRKVSRQVRVCMTAFLMPFTPCKIFLLYSLRLTFFLLYRNSLDIRLSRSLFQACCYFPACLCRFCCKLYPCCLCGSPQRNTHHAIFVNWHFWRIEFFVRSLSPVIWLATRRFCVLQPRRVLCGGNFSIRCAIKVVSDRLWFEVAESVVRG